MKIQILRTILFASALLLSTVQQSAAQESAQLDIKRGSVDNFLKDHSVLVSSDKKKLDSVFQVTLPSTGQTIYWSTIACRLIGIKNGKSTTLTELEASGSHPLHRSIGAIGKPKFFGMRIVENGLPEFLYSVGQLSVEEKFQFSADGKKIFQSVKIQSGAIQTNYTIPADWREVVTGDNGRWSDNTLTLNRVEMGEGFTFTYHLDPNDPKPTKTVSTEN